MYQCNNIHIYANISTYMYTHGYAISNITYSDPHPDEIFSKDE